MPIVDEVVLANYKNRLRSLFLSFYNNVNEERVSKWAITLYESNRAPNAVYKVLEDAALDLKMPTLGDLLNMSQTSSLLKEKTYTSCEFCLSGLIDAYDSMGYKYSFRCRCDSGSNHGEAIPVWDSAKYKDRYTTQYVLDKKNQDKPVPTRRLDG